MGSGEPAQTEELEIRGRVSSNVHRLGNLISVIIAEAQLIQTEYEPDTPAHQSAVAIERAARALEEMIGFSSSNGAGNDGEIPRPGEHGGLPSTARG